MQMSIKAISLANIVTSNGLKISQNAFLVLLNNSLREQFEWPYAPQKNYKKTSGMLTKRITSDIQCIASNPLRKKSQTIA